MKIVALCGSPKGDLSITLQHVHYIRKKFAQHEIKIVNISEDIVRIEKDAGFFQEIMNEVKGSDGILWAFPLYYFLVPAQYKRFIELIWERNSESHFKDKYTAVITTSINFFDNIAHNYMNAICDDLGMRYFGSFSAGMDDLLKKGERERFHLFVEEFIKSIENRVATPERFNRLVDSGFKYIPGKATGKIDAGNKKVIVLTDARPDEASLAGMIKRLTDSFSGIVEVVNLNDLNIKGGCLGCIHCGLDNVCVYKDTDDYDMLHNEKLKNADMVVFAGAVKDRYLSSRWKTFFDRSFFNNHVPYLVKKQVGFIIAGPLRQLPDLRQALEAYTECMQANIAGFVTDEYPESIRIDSLLQDLARQLLEYADKNYIRPCTFLSIGGRKVLRDYIRGMRFVLQGDDRYYRRHGMYDFPRTGIMAGIFSALIILFTKIPYVRRKFASKIRENLVSRHKKVIEKL